MHESNRTTLIYFTTLFSTVSIKVHKDISWNPDLLQSTHRSWYECVVLEQQSLGSVLIQCNLTKNNGVQNPKLLVFNCWNTLTISSSVYAKINGLPVHQNSRWHIFSSFTTFWTLGSCRIKLHLKLSSSEQHISLISDQIFLLGSLPFALPFVLHNLRMHSSWFVLPSFTASLPLRHAELLEALRLLSVYYWAPRYVVNFPSQESLHFFDQGETILLFFFSYPLVNG